MSQRNVIAPLICTLLAATFLTGCLIVDNTNRSHRGTLPSASTMKQVEIGTTTVDWLIGAVGKPSSRQEVDEHTELLRYERVTTVTKQTTIFLILHSQDNSDTSEVTVFEAIDGVIQRHWTETADGK